MISRDRFRCVWRRIGCPVAIVLLSVGMGWIAPAAAADADGCRSGGGEAAIAACRQVLADAPGDVAARLALSDALMSLRRYADAVAVLREGFEHAPGDARIKRQLSLAESYLDEQAWIESQQQRQAAASQTRSQDTAVRLNLIRCRTLTGEDAMKACNEGLALAPDHPELLVQRGNRWLAMDRIGRAIVDYQAALAVDSTDRNAARQLRLARTQRNVKLALCRGGTGSEALDACDAAMLPGADDAAAIQKRRGELLHAMGRESAAVAAYRAAARRDPGDVQVRQALAALAPREPPPPSISPVVGTPATKTAPPVPVTANVEKAPSPKKELAAPPPPPEEKVATATAAPPKPTVRVAATPAAPPAPPAPAPEAPHVGERSTSTEVPAMSPTALPVAQVRRYSNAPEQPGIIH